MRIDSEQVSQHLKRGLAPLYTVFGEELLLAIEAADRIRAAAAAAGHDERTLLFADQQFDWSELRDAGQSLSLFSARRIIDLRIPSGKPGKDGAEALVQLAEAPPADTVTLVSLPGLDFKTMKTRWFQALEAGSVAVHAKPIAREQLPRWIAARLALQQQQASAETLAFIADRVEGNLMAAYQEVQKLALLFAPGQLPFDDVRNAVLDVARYDVFELGATLLRGDRGHFVRMLDGLHGEGVAPPLVLWVIAEEARALARVGAIVAGGVPVAQAIREARVWGARQQLMPRAVGRLTQAQLHRVLERAAAVDRMIKGLGVGDVWDALLALGLMLMPPPAASRKTIGGRISRSV